MNNLKKKKEIVFFRNFSIRKKTLYSLGLVYTKNYFNLTEVFVLRQFKTKPNQREYSNPEQRSVIKSLVTENSKPWKIYWRMCDAYREACFRKKKIYKWARPGFATRSPNRKNSPRGGNTWTPVEKKFYVKWSVKKAIMTVVWDMKRIVSWFPWKNVLL